ncbi:TPA: acyltransferase family protein, partial [Klebsiella quasipneumoniae subsp. quasipneumoniae]|nr:acyltransferase family protein [Klebsiella quasipneumoniae subsp. quasipneumoniae]
ILVITGHILPGNANEGVRGIIYYFHMPLFLAVTGYFIKDKNLKQTFKSLFTKYNTRLLTPYAIAFLAYTCSYFYLSIGISKIHIKHIVGAIIYPFYHLWYIPAILLFISYTKIINKNNRFIFGAFIISTIVSITWYAYGETLTSSYPLIKYLGDKRFYYYYSFFLLGYILGNDTIVSIRVDVSLILCLIVPLLKHFINPSPLLDAMFWYLFNLSLINLTVTTCRKSLIINENLLTKLGKTSLPVYLWHVAIISIVATLVDTNNSLYYIIVTLLVIALSLFFIYAHNKNKLLNKFFYGEPT